MVDTIKGAKNAKEAFSEDHVETNANGKSINKTLNFTTNTLITSNIEDHATSEQQSLGVNIGINNAKDKGTSKNEQSLGTSSINASHSGHDYQATTQATIGEGAVVTSDANALVNVNRDVNTATVITKNQDIGGLNANLTVDSRVFTEAGRAQIKAEQEDLGKNLRKVVAITALDGILTGTIVSALVTGEVDQTGNAVGKVLNAKDIGATDAKLAKTVNEVDSQKIKNTPELSSRLDKAISTGDANAGNRIALAEQLTDELGKPIAGAASTTTQLIYLNVSKNAPLVDVVTHETMHLNGANEHMASATGWFANAAFGMGNIINQDAVSNESAYNFTALTPAASQTNTHAFTVEQLKGQVDYWGSVGHQSTTAAAAYLGGFLPEVAKAIGISAFAPDADKRNAMSTLNIIKGFIPFWDGNQEKTHALDANLSPAEVKVEQEKAIAKLKDILQQVKDANGDAVKIAIILKLESNQDVLHKAGDVYAHVGDFGTHYLPGIGHFFSSILGMVGLGTDPDDPSQNPKAYREYLIAVYQAAAEVTGKPRANVTEAGMVADVVSSESGKNAHQTEERQMKRMQNTLNDNFPIVVIPPDSTVPVVVQPNIVEKENLKDWGIFGTSPGAKPENATQAVDRIDEALGLKKISSPAEKIK